MRRHHSEEPGEVRTRDQKRASEVCRILEKAGIPLDVSDAPVYVRVEMAQVYHAVDLRLWENGDEPGGDALQDRIDAALWAAGYLVHRSSYQAMRAYLPSWGGDLPEVQLMAADLAASLGIQPATWRSYVSRGQAPEADGHHSANAPWWNCSTIDRWRRDRPGQGARTDRPPA